MIDQKLARKVGDRLDLGVVYHIDHTGEHNFSPMLDIVQGRRLVIFGGPAPFSRLDTLQATRYAELSQAMMKHVDLVYGIYVQDAFVCRAFEDKIDAAVGENPLVILADGDSFFLKNSQLQEDFTNHGLGIRSCRWASVVNDGEIEYIAGDPYSMVDQTSADSLLKYLESK